MVWTISCYGNIFGTIFYKGNVLGTIFCKGNVLGTIFWNGNVLGTIFCEAATLFFVSQLNHQEVWSYFISLESPCGVPTYNSYLRSVSKWSVHWLCVCVVYHFSNVYLLTCMDVASYIRGGTRTWYHMHTAQVWMLKWAAWVFFPRNLLARQPVGMQWKQSPIKPVAGTSILIMLPTGFLEHTSELVPLPTPAAPSPTYPSPIPLPPPPPPPPKLKPPSSRIVLWLSLVTADSKEVAVMEVNYHCRLTHIAFPVKLLLWNNIRRRKKYSAD